MSNLAGQQINLTYPSSADVKTYSTTVAQPQIGFALNTIK